MNSKDIASSRRVPGVVGSLKDTEQEFGVYNSVSQMPYNPFGTVYQERQQFAPYIPKAPLPLQERAGDPTIRRHVITMDEVGSFRKSEIKPPSFSFDAPQSSTPPAPSQTAPKAPTTPQTGNSGTQPPSSATNATPKLPPLPKLSTSPGEKTVSGAASKMFGLGKQFGSAVGDPTGAGGLQMITGAAEAGINKLVDKQKDKERRADQSALDQYKDQVAEVKKQHATQQKQAKDIQQAGEKLMATKTGPAPQKPSQLIAPIPNKPAQTGPLPKLPPSPVTIPKAALPKPKANMPVAPPKLKDVGPRVNPITGTKQYPNLTPRVPEAAKPTPKAGPTGPALSPEHLASLKMKGFAVEIEQDDDDGRGDSDRVEKGFGMNMFGMEHGNHEHTAQSFWGTPFQAKALELQAEDHECKAKCLVEELDDLGEDLDPEEFQKKLSSRFVRRRKIESKWHQLQADRDRWKAQELRKRDKVQKSASGLLDMRGRVTSKKLEEFRKSWTEESSPINFWRGKLDRC